MDALGALTLIAAVTCLLLALQWGGQTLPWNSSRVIGLFVGFGVLTIVFGLSQWRLGNKATIPLRILRQRSVIMGCFYIALLDMTAYTVSRWILKVILLIHTSVRLLHALLLPRRTRCIRYNQWRTIHAVGYSSNSGNRGLWCPRQ